MKRSPLRRKTPLKQGESLKRGESALKRTPLKQIGRKAKREASKRRETVETVRARDRFCQAASHGLGGRCWGPLDVHEVIPRGRGGSPLDPGNCVLLCRGHHSIVTDNPALGERVGLIRSRRPEPG